ncbi:hypothetical protein ACQP2P_04085 [Dactylosporangium sp. CA-139114]|uniref:hypothetical protein n=1 Tax=Dactylosporangium sp. CA-139114 TaxID=3239931 RepID=UPI003D967C5C
MEPMPEPVLLLRSGSRPARVAGTATAATHRCLWGALAAAIAWPVLSACGVGHPQAAAVAVGLLTVLPWLGPLLGVLLAAVLAALVPQPYAPLLGLAAAALVTLAAAPAQHLPGRFGPLSIPAASAAAVLGGVAWGVLGALIALAVASLTARSVAARSLAARGRRPRSAR